MLQSKLIIVFSEPFTFWDKSWLETKAETGRDSGGNNKLGRRIGGGKQDFLIRFLSENKII